MTTLEAARGTHDLLPPETELWNRIEAKANCGVAAFQATASEAAMVLQFARKLAREDPQDERLQVQLARACEYLAYTESDLAAISGDSARYAQEVRLDQE